MTSQAGRVRRWASIALMAVVTVGLSVLCVSGRAMGAQGAALHGRTSGGATDHEAIVRTDCTAAAAVRLVDGKVSFRAANTCGSRH